MKVPILKLGDVLLTSIPEELTDEDALEFQSDLLEKIEKTSAKGVVIDITALQLVDSFMARVINETANMARLLGSECVLCGMNPSVAIALVQMGRELIGVEAALNLEYGVAKLRELLAAKGETLKLG